jgi:replicative DNA helicase
MTERPVLPHNYEAEQALIGIVLSENALLSRVSAEPGDFFDPLHIRMWQAIRATVKAGGMASPVSLKGIFESDPALKEIGGARYLTSLTSAVFAQVTPEAAEGYDRVVRDLSQRRRIVELCQEGIERALEPSAETTAAEIASEIASGCREQRFQVQSQHSYRELLHAVVEGLQHPVIADSTGLLGLDACMGGGLVRGRSYAFCARKKSGKTILAATLSYNLNAAGIPHLFIACEMSAEEIVQRMMARALGRNPLAFLNRDDRHLLEEAAQFAVTAPSHALFDHAPGLAFEDLRRKISEAAIKQRIHGVILDYWQLVGGVERGHTQAMHQDRVAQFLADAARREGIWVIAMAQLNQDGNTRGGEGIRLAFDQAFELHREPDSEGAWLQMIETRHTPWQDLGSKHQPGIWLHTRGLYFDERPLVELAAASQARRAARREPA